MKTPFRSLRSLGWIGAVLLVIIFASCQKRPATQNYFPETGPPALHQISLDLKNGTRVLSLALRPGYEDLAALAYLRLAEGATIASAYVSNGEAGESDLGTLYPDQLAGTLRLEADAALAYLNGEAYFLNQPEVVAARDSLAVRRAWRSDSLSARLAGLLLKYKPDIILVARDWSAPEQSWQRKILLADLLNAAQKILPPPANGSTAAINSDSLWQVGRIWVDDPAQSGVRVPVDNQHPKWQKSFKTIAGEAGAKYASLRHQRKAWQGAKQPSYTLLYPQTSTNLQTLCQGYPDLTRLHYLRNMGGRMAQLAGEVQEKTAKELAPVLLSTLDSIGIHIALRNRLSSLEERSLYAWKMSIDRLRSNLLNIKVDYAIGDTALTVVQVTQLTIKDIAGLSEIGETSINFSALPKDWAVNESLERRFAYEPGKIFTLLTPQSLPFNTPQNLFGLQAPQASHKITFHLVHRSANREQSFIKTINQRMYYAPRFLVEVLTPIVRAIPGEKIELRMKNYSRDGVADTIEVAQEAVTSTPGLFRLSNKEAEQNVTLYLDWPKEIEEGTHVFPITIDGDEVAQFAARQFRAEIDRNRRIGILTTANNTLLKDALRRLTVRSANLVVNPERIQQMDSLDVIIVDRRALALDARFKDKKSSLQAFVEKGGHVIILAQDPESWNRTPLWDGLQLAATQQFDESFPLQNDEQHPVLNSPNRLTAQDWEGWLYRRGYNFVSLGQKDGVEMPVTAAGEGTPLLLTRKLGQGKMTYVDLALTPQWLNVQPGAYRLLANLISY